MRCLVLAVLLVACPLNAQEPVIWKDQPGWVGALAFSPSKNLLAIGAGDGSLALWDAKTGKKHLDLEGHADAVSALAWSRAGDVFASGGHDHQVVLHTFDKDFAKIKQRRVLKGHTGAVLTVVFGDNDLLCSGGIDGTIRIWDVKTREERKLIRDHTSWVNALAIDRDGQWLASASSDNTVRLRNLSSFAVKHVFRVTEGEVRAVAFSPDGKFLAAGIRYGTVRVWNLDTLKEAASFKAHAGETWAVAFSPDSKTLLSGGGDWNKPSPVRLWDVGTWKEHSLDHSGEVLCLAVSREGLVAAGSWDRSVRLWDWPRRK
jgi:WD40 repeat protein